MRKIKLVETLKKGLYQAKVSTGRMYKYISTEQGKPITGTEAEIKAYCEKNFGECKFY